MRIGFLDCASNKADAFDPFSKIAGEEVAGASVDRLTAPDILKVPLCAKKLFSKGSDTVIAFLTLSQDDLDPMALVHEKIIDLELFAEKSVLFCIVSDDEYSDQAGFESLVQARFRTALRLATELELSPSSVSQMIGDPKVAAELSALAGFAASMASGGEPQGASPPTGDSVHSIF